MTSNGTVYRNQSYYIWRDTVSSVQMFISRQLINPYRCSIKTDHICCRETFVHTLTIEGGCDRLNTEPSVWAIDFFVDREHQIQQCCKVGVHVTRGPKAQNINCSGLWCYWSREDRVHRCLWSCTTVRYMTTHGVTGWMYGIRSPRSILRTTQVIWDVWTKDQGLGFTLGPGRYPA